jgi:hypothetical protein
VKFFVRFILISWAILAGMVLGSIVVAVLAV